MSAAAPLHNAALTRVAPAPARTVYSVHPWDPVPLSRAEELPDRVSPQWVSERFDRSKSQFARILRAHLVPAKKNDARYTRQWRMLWRSVGFLDRRMRSRVLKMLQDWRDAAEAALAVGDLDDADTTIIGRFVKDVNGAIQRIDREGREPMAWGGNEFIGYPSGARIMIEALVVAIDEHRAGNLTDSQLHAILQSLDVDPETARTDSAVPEGTRRRVLAAARSGEPLEVDRSLRGSAGR